MPSKTKIVPREVAPPCVMELIIIAAFGLVELLIRLKKPAVLEGRMVYSGTRIVSELVTGGFIRMAPLWLTHRTPV